MLFTLLAGGLLVALTVAVHAVGLGLMLRSLMKADLPWRLWATTSFLVKVTWQLILIHLAEISVWALFYWVQRCMPDVESAFYFAGVTYTTVGYGDLVLPKQWRLLGPIEALTGILMCGLSTGFFFAVVSKIHLSRTRPEEPV